MHRRDAPVPEFSGDLPANGVIQPTVFCPTTRHLVGMGIVSSGDAGQGFPLLILPTDDSSTPDADADAVPDDYATISITNGPPGPVAPYTATATCL